MKETVIRLNDATGEQGGSGKHHPSSILYLCTRSQPSKTTERQQAAKIHSGFILGNNACIRGDDRLFRIDPGPYQWVFVTCTRHRPPPFLGLRLLLRFGREDGIIMAVSLLLG